MHLKRIGDYIFILIKICDCTCLCSRPMLITAFIREFRWKSMHSSFNIQVRCKMQTLLCGGHELVFQWVLFVLRFENDQHITYSRLFASSLRVRSTNSLSFLKPANKFLSVYFKIFSKIFLFILFHKQLIEVSHSFISSWSRPNLFLLNENELIC